MAWIYDGISGKVAHLQILALACICLGTSCDAHEHAQQAAPQADGGAELEARLETEAVVEGAAACELTIDLTDEFSGESVPGLVRVINLDSGKAVALEAGFHRAKSWYSLPEQTTLRLPKARVRIEALQGLETLRSEREVDLRSTAPTAIAIPLKRFYESRFREWYAGNTHLHLRKMARAEAERYLQVVSRSDGLDLVCLSYLRRLPAEQDYISNEIVEESFRGGDVLERLSSDKVLIANGEELRHNFGPDGEGYGHAMLLGLHDLVQPVSLGSGIMQEGTDGSALQPGIHEAHAQDATVIWCHNAFGFEDLPNWIQGLIHAQNLFDGGSQKRYEDTCYRYLDIGLQVPFSTGTDWFVYDFARVYVPVYGKPTAVAWLAGLRKGKSYITNGPLLELETELAGIGETLELDSPGGVTVRGRALGRLDFGELELVFNGQVVQRVPAVRQDGYYQAELRHILQVDQPGWFAIRIPADVGDTELGHPLFAHTSPIYVHVGGQTIFRPEVAQGLIDEMQTSLQTIEAQAVFANEGERQRVLAVYRDAIKTLESKLPSATSR